MSEFAREAVLTSVDSGGSSPASLGSDLVTLTNRLHELDKLLKAVSGLITRVLGEGREAAPDQPGEQFREGGTGS